MNRSAIVLGGKSGLLGQALSEGLAAAGWKTAPVGRADFDPFDEDALKAVMEREDCDTIFNTVAYTAVDKAEDEPDEAYRLNKILPAQLARVCVETGAKLVHYSTDFVFDGKSEKPYTPDDKPRPQSMYGKSKLAGERAIAEADPAGWCIVRTSWLFGPYKPNFVAKMIELAQTRDHLRVVHDQIGSPTYTRDLARNSAALVEAGGQGIFHLACSGRASWCELAAEAISVAGMTAMVEAIESSEWPTKAKRPAFSVLDTEAFTKLTGVAPRAWNKALRDYIFTDLGLPL
jgi:dTDP-4-dehydrorhamnose reductase